MSIQTLAKSFVGALGAFLGYFVGGVDVLIKALVLLIVVDYISGMIASALSGELKSKTGFVGILKKVVIIFLVGVAVQLDLVLETNSAVRDATIFIFLGNELLSILENAGRIGVPLPEPLVNAVEVLRGKSEKKKGDVEQ